MTGERFDRTAAESAARKLGTEYQRLLEPGERIGESVRATIVAWITPGQVKQLAEAAPDLWAWRSALLDFGIAAESPSEVHRHSLDLGLAVIGDRQDRLEEIDAYLKTVSEPRSKDAGLMLEAAEILKSIGALDAATLQAVAALSAYQQTGDARGAVLAKGQIADILLARGELDEALLLHEQRLAVFRRLGDVDGIAHVRFSIARIRLRRSDLDSGELDRIRDDLAQAFEILTKFGRPDGIGAVGLLFAEVLVMGGDQKAAFEVLAKAEAAFEKIGGTVGVERVRRFRVRIEDDSTLDQ